jgi:hypothetical protein
MQSVLDAEHACLCTSRGAAPPRQQCFARSDASLNGARGRRAAEPAARAARSSCSLHLSHSAASRTQMDTPEPVVPVPRKRVRFSETLTFRSAPPSPPSSPPPGSPSLSDSTFSDCSPRTPPNVLPPLPAPKGVDVQMHPLLASESGSTLTCDLGKPLDTSGWPVSMLAHAATYPPLPYIRILHDMIPYPITVMPDTLPLSPPTSPVLPTFSPSASPLDIDVPPYPSSVRLVDVLLTLHTFLSTPLSRAELAALPLSLATNMEHAFAARRARMPTPRTRMLAAAAGVARADFLLGATQFAGLKPTKHPDIWVLATALP